MEFVVFLDVGCWNLEFPFRRPELSAQFRPICVHLCSSVVLSCVGKNEPASAFFNRVGQKASSKQGNLSWIEAEISALQRGIPFADRSVEQNSTPGTEAGAILETYYMKQMAKSEIVLIRVVCGSVAALALILAGCHSTESSGGDAAGTTNSATTNASGSMETNSATATNAAVMPLLLDNGGNLASH